MTLQIKSESRHITAIALFPEGSEYFDHNRDMTHGCLEPNGIYVEFNILKYFVRHGTAEVTFTCKRDEFEKLQNAIAK